MLKLRGYVYLGTFTLLLCHHPLRAWLSDIVALSLPLLGLLFIVARLLPIAIGSLMLLWWVGILSGSCLVRSADFGWNFSFLDTGKLCRVHSVFSFLIWIDVQRLLTAWLLMHFDWSPLRARIVMVHEAYIGVIGILGLLVSLDEVLVVRGWSAHLLISLTAKFV